MEFRRIRNWAREVEWLTVIAVVLLVVGAILAILTLWHIMLAVLALVSTGSGIAVSILSLRS